MSMSVKLDWRHALTVAGTLRAPSPASAIQDMSWALMAGNATVSYFSRS